MPDPLEVNRRHFLATAAVFCTCALSCPYARTADAADGDDDGEPTKALPAVPIGKADVGTPADYAKDGVYGKWADSPQQKATMPSIPVRTEQFISRRLP